MGVIFDLFSGSGTTSVAAKKLQRNYIGIKLNGEYCYLILMPASKDIQMVFFGKEIHLICK